MKKSLQFAAAVVLAFSPSIYAATTTLLTLSDGLGNTVNIDQNGAVTGTGTFTDASSAGTGPHKTITFVGSVGSFDFIVTTGRGGDVEVLPSLMNLNSIDAIATGAGTLTTTFSDTDYTDLTGTLNLSASNTFTAGTADGSTVNFKAYGSSTNVIPATTLIGNLATFTDTALALAAQSNAATQNYTNPIGSSGSLTEKVTLVFSGAGEIDSGFTIADTVPEPSSVVLLGTLLFGVAGIVRKRFANRA